MNSKLLLLTISLLFTFSIHASEYKCTTWTKTQGISCIFAGNSADIYERQCENACWRGRYGRGNWGADCDQQRVCSDKNPKLFEDVCSKWVRVSSITCRNPNTGDWEQKWARVCTVGLSESWCSDKNPNK